MDDKLNILKLYAILTKSWFWNDMYNIYLLLKGFLSCNLLVYKAVKLVFHLHFLSH